VEDYCGVSNGNWICGFAKSLGTCNAFVAELWGVLEGLNLARVQGYGTMGYRAVKHCIDSEVVVRVLKDSKLRNVGVGR
jgi:hypothetical protein